MKFYGALCNLQRHTGSSHGNGLVARPPFEFKLVIAPKSDEVFLFVFGIYKLFWFRFVVWRRLQNERIRTWISQRREEWSRED
jgi:hypothetical protein